MKFQLFRYGSHNNDYRFSMLFMILSTDLVYEEQECIVVKSGKDTTKMA